MNQQRCNDLSSILAALVVVIVGLFAVAVDRGCANPPPAISARVTQGELATP